jgi:hypothetical protein
MHRAALIALLAADAALAHPFRVGGEEIPHAHLSPELLLLAGLVGLWTVLRSRK